MRTPAEIRAEMATLMGNKTETPVNDPNIATPQPNSQNDPNVSPVASPQRQLNDPNLVQPEQSMQAQPTAMQQPRSSAEILAEMQALTTNPDAEFDAMKSIRKLREIQRNMRSVESEPDYSSLDRINRFDNLVLEEKGIYDSLLKVKGYTKPQIGKVPVHQDPDKSIRLDNLVLEEKGIYDSLLKEGYTKPQISLALETIKIAEPYGKLREQLITSAGAVSASLATTALIGQIPPLTALPEELVTVPLVAAISAFAGGYGGNVAAQKTNPDNPTIDQSHALWEGGKEALWEGGLRYGILGAKYGFRGAKHLASLKIKNWTGLSDQAKDISRYDKISRYYGGGLAMDTKHPDNMTVSMLNDWAKSSLGGDIYYDLMDKKAQTGVLRYFDNKIDLRCTFDDAGKQIVEQFHRGGKGMPKGLKVDIINEVTDPIYKEIDDIAGLTPVQKTVQRPSKFLTKGGQPMMADVVVDTFESKANAYVGDLKKWASKRLAEHTYSIEHGAKGTLDDSAVKLLQEIEGLGAGSEAKTSEEILAFLSGNQKKEDWIPHKTLRDLRTKWMKAGSSIEYQTNVTQGTFDEAIKEATSALNHEKTLASLPPHVAEKLRNANAFYAQTSDVLDELFDKKLIDTLRIEPQKAVSALLPNKGASKISAVRSTLTKMPSGQIDIQGTIAWDKLRYAKIGSFLENSLVFDAKSKTYFYDINKLRSQLTEFGDDALQELLKSTSSSSGRDYRNFKRGVRLLELSQNVGGRPYAIVGAGLQLRHAGQAMAGVGALTYIRTDKDKSLGDWIAITTLGAVAVSPTILAKMMTTPGGQDALEGIAKVSSKPGGMTAPLIARLVRVWDKSIEDEKKMDAKSEKEFIYNIRKEEQRKAYDLRAKEADKLTAGIGVTP